MTAWLGAVFVSAALCGFWRCRRDVPHWLDRS